MSLLIPYAKSLHVGDTYTPDEDVASNYQKFDGLDVPVTSDMGGDRMGIAYGGKVPNPGQLDQNPQDHTYTPGPLRGLTNTIGGMPRPTADPIFRTGQGATYGGVPSRQFAKGDTNNSGGIYQTILMDQISQNTPQPGDLASIIQGL